MTTVGPLLLSGSAAGPSVEGPRAASVSVRFSSLRAGVAVDEDAVGCVVSDEPVSPAGVGFVGASWTAPASPVVVVVLVPSGAPLVD